MYTYIYSIHIYILSGKFRADVRSVSAGSIQGMFRVEGRQQPPFAGIGKMYSNITGLSLGVSATWLKRGLGLEVLQLNWLKPEAVKCITFTWASCRITYLHTTDIHTYVGTYVHT